jgi:hypothetical protein
MKVERCECKETDYGFALVYPDSIEMFGMAGIGRFELFATIIFSKEDNVAELVEETLKENEEDLWVFRKTKKLLGPERKQGPTKPLDSELKQLIQYDFAAWSGGFEPFDEHQIETYLTKAIAVRGVDIGEVRAWLKTQIGCWKLER